MHDYIADISGLKQYSNNRKMPAYRDTCEHYKTLVVLHDGAMRTVCKVSMKFPRDGAGRVSCIVWVSTPGAGYSWGAGTASGYGYHKPSAAFSAAIRDAGVSLTHECGKTADIGGVGDGAIDDAMLAITKAVYGQDFTNLGANPNALIVS